MDDSWGACLQTLEGHSDNFWDVVFLLDGKRVRLPVVPPHNRPADLQKVTFNSVQQNRVHGRQSRFLDDPEPPTNGRSPGDPEHSMAHLN
ncbi:hypothetical protein LTR56_025502 [Elasticomyces elasticus]|nr:hypothetical protein LTR56_025502 [Elasticomyces elasticus]KAK3619398.1 hypothetical protein LTR22_025996 [Elasticomyces elasticus]KAK4907680.1 hypothetical protein LTR49_023333 [Elasticomyces elasticus]KAK5747896.1 hypothetical protein LTS12_022042 [Elasticomyces elasticus]